MNLSYLEQQIYNSYLKHLRSGKAWKPRKDFSDLPKETLITLNKLSTFFQKFKHIDVDKFLETPLILHPEENYPLLKFFTSRKAIKYYKLVSQLKENESPDKQLPSIKEGLKFITKFCLEKGINWSDYLLYKEEYMPLWIQHYKEQRVNIYSLVVCENHQYITSIPQEDLDVWLPNFLDKFFQCKTRLHSSQRVKTSILTVVSSLKKFISENLLNYSKQ